MDDKTGAAPHSVVRLNALQIRMLAHPLRARLLGLLRVDGPATATTLARLLDTNTGATSYHLRQLADVGLVAEEAELGTSRQRFWRAAHDASTWLPTDFDDDPDARAAAEWIESQQVQLMSEQAERWLASRQQAPQAWREASTISDAMLTLAPQRLRELNDEIWALILKYRQDPALAAEEDAAQVHMFLVNFPRAEELR
ncbi:winged helix-turn-helix domain-containing protein [Catellatospora vulcania]|uniref:winged helix-turn-helix domain-containing protein n=1 Tax=Catellatospora vulcania TaxID=1460450 RepID=UPI001E3E2426|nr:helix-turn-helix domain-containing protein [Catellatospora vulcania]